jgi:hypothetical protein
MLKFWKRKKVIHFQHMVPKGEYILVDMDSGEFDKFANEEGALVFEYDGVEYMPVSTAIGSFLIRRVKKGAPAKDTLGDLHVHAGNRGAR